MKTPPQPAPAEWFASREPNEGRVFVRSGTMQGGTTITNYTTGLLSYAEVIRRNGDTTFRVPCVTEDDANTPPDRPSGAARLYADEERPWLYWAEFADRPAPEDQQSAWRALTGTVMLEDDEGERLMWAHLKAKERSKFAGLFWKDHKRGAATVDPQDAPPLIQYPLF